MESNSTAPRRARTAVFHPLFSAGSAKQRQAAGRQEQYRGQRERRAVPGRGRGGRRGRGGEAVPAPPVGSSLAGAVGSAVGSPEGSADDGSVGPSVGSVGLSEGSGGSADGSVGGVSVEGVVGREASSSVSCASVLTPSGRLWPPPGFLHRRFVRGGVDGLPARLHRRRQLLPLGLPVIGGILVIGQLRLGGLLKPVPTPAGAEEPGHPPPPSDPPRCPPASSENRSRRRRRPGRLSPPPHCPASPFPAPRSAPLPLRPPARRRHTARRGAGSRR